jgi:hypothetical protein
MKKLPLERMEEREQETIDRLYDEGKDYCKKAFNHFYKDAESGFMASESCEKFPMVNVFSVQSTDENAEHPGLTLAHVSVRNGHLPWFLADDDNHPAWAWEADDGYTVRDAYADYQNLAKA